MNPATDFDWNLGSVLRRERASLAFFAALFVVGIVVAVIGPTLGAITLLVASVLGFASRVLTGMLRPPGE